MKVVIPRQADPEEPRIAATPESVTVMKGMELEVVVGAGLGEHLGWSDADYEKAGATIASGDAIYEGADLIACLQPPSADEIAKFPRGSMYTGFLDPFNRDDLVRAFADAGVAAMSMEMVPRTTRAQKLDALSSQHSLAGYYMVLLAAEKLGKALPMMATPSGVIQPARILVIGAGVAGLQAIATAKRLGARIEAFDTRPAVKEQCESLGARFIDIDLGVGEGQGGYAKELTPEQQAKQREGMVKALHHSNIVITTAALFGRPAPKIITDEMLQQMKPGSLIIDYAVSTGGNVEGSVADEEVNLHGVRVLGLKNFPGRVAFDASRMYANNIVGLVQVLFDKESKNLVLNTEDDIIAGCLITKDGEVVNETIRERMAQTA
ncbi:MAG: NAD(P) transhydrogenase subunit alpha [Phycisphaeraceae bacterium]|nr:MAG: NAD(P) transhydrogenase subunit alpha [Phycisphaeraceae bacterium]